ncbi:MAG TPA: hypothetical protein VGE08_11535 [Steroidobacter sp.]|uniref:hypothetical protein n=1 Tax=Steroidobacter sp. TaxID=1978227 RepID=UPI002EDA113F
MKGIRPCLGMMLGLAVAPAMADTCYSAAASSNVDAGVSRAGVYYTTPAGVPVYVPLFGTSRNLGGVTTSEPSALMDAAYVRGSNRELWEVTNTGVWTSLKGDITWNPEAVALPDATGTRRMVFYRGTNREIWYVERTGGTWGPHTSLGGVATSSPAAVSWGNGHVAVFKRGQSNDIWYRERIGGVWSSWITPGGSVSTSVDPAVVTHGTGTYTVFVRNGGVILMNKYNGVWSGWVSLGGPPPGAISEPAAVAMDGASYAVFVRGNTQDAPAWRYRAIFKNVSLDGGVTWSGWQAIMAQSHESTNNPEAVADGGRYIVAASDITNGYGSLNFCIGTVP